MGRYKKEINDRTYSTGEDGADVPEEFADGAFNDMGDEGEELSPSQVRAALAIKVVAALTALIFIFMVLANVLHLFTWPSLDFLKESRRLRNDPVLQELQQAVVQVLYVSRDSAALPVAQSKGTGFNIHPSGLIVTNKHVVEGADAITVSFEGRGTYVASHWTKSSRLDLALLYLDLKENAGADTAGNTSLRSLPFVELQLQHFPEIGADVITMGNPLGFRRIISRGTVSAYHPLTDLPYPVLEIEAPIHAGSSGSPVFDNENKVVAVVYAVLRQQNQDNDERIKGLAIPVMYLQELLEEAELD
jgi:serine protease Do